MSTQETMNNVRRFVFEEFSCEEPEVRQEIATDLRHCTSIQALVEWYGGLFIEEREAAMMTAILTTLESLDDD